MEGDRWVRDITGSRTQQIMLEIVQVDEKLRAVTLTSGIADKFTWKWTSNGQYSSSSAYRAFFAGSTTLLGAVADQGAAQGQVLLLGGSSWMVMDNS